MTVDTTDNEDDEANRYFEFRMSNPQGGGGPTPLLSTTQFVKTTIVDNDGDPSSVVFSALTRPPSERVTRPGTVNVTATLEGGTLTENAIVAVTLAGRATKGSTGDYTATALGNITITGGETSGTGSFTVTPVNDVVVEGDETILLSGSLRRDGRDSCNHHHHRRRHRHRWASPVPPFWWFPRAITPSSPSRCPTQWPPKWWLRGRQVLRPRLPASADDYSPDSGSVIFPAGSAAGATKTITMAIADDGAEEQEETFTVTLGSVTGDLASKVSVDSAKSSADVSIASRRDCDGHPA